MGKRVYQVTLADGSVQTIDASQVKVQDVEAQGRVANRQAIGDTKPKGSLRSLPLTDDGHFDPTLAAEWTANAENLRTIAAGLPKTQASAIAKTADWLEQGCTMGQNMQSKGFTLSDLVPASGGGDEAEDSGDNAE